MLNLVLTSTKWRKKTDTKEVSNYSVTICFLQQAFIVLLSILIFIFETAIITQFMKKE